MVLFSEKLIKLLKIYIYQLIKIQANWFLRLNKKSNAILNQKISLKTQQRQVELDMVLQNVFLSFIFLINDFLSEICFGFRKQSFTKLKLLLL